MFSRPQTWLAITLPLVVACFSGCRGANPLARHVQVTPESDLPVPDIAPPLQRLATSRTRTDGDVGSQPSASNIAQMTHLEDSPHVRGAEPRQDTAVHHRLESRIGDDLSHAFEVSDQISTKPPIRSNSVTVTNGQTQVESAPMIRLESHSSTPTNSATQPRKSARNQPMALPAGAQDMLEAFKNSPPEVQEAAIRQLIAAASMTASKTSQPKPIEPVLEQSLEEDADTINELLSRPSEPDVKLASLNQAAATPPVDDASTRSAKTSGVQRAGMAQEVNPSGAAKSSDTSNVVQTSASSGYTESLSDQNSFTTASLTDKVTEPSASQLAVKTTLETPKSDAPSEPAEAVATSGKTADRTRSGGLDALAEQALYDELLKRLSQPVAGESEGDRSRRLIMARHLMVLSGKIDDAVSGVEELPQDEQEFLRHQLLGLWTLIDPQGHPVPGRRFTAALPELRQATNHLSAATDSLEVRSLAFCTEIESYGQVKKFPSYRFKAGQQVILYCEIENFVATQISEGYETHLQGSYDVFDEAGVKVASQLLPADRQVSNNYLRDYFIAYQMYLPKDVTAGKYRMQLTLEDLNSKKYGQSTIHFDIIR